MRDRETTALRLQHITFKSFGDLATNIDRLMVRNRIISDDTVENEVMKKEDYVWLTADFVPPL